MSDHITLDDLRAAPREEFWDRASRYEWSGLAWDDPERDQIGVQRMREARDIAIGRGWDAEARRVEERLYVLNMYEQAEHRHKPDDSFEVWAEIWRDLWEQARTAGFPEAAAKAEQHYRETSKTASENAELKREIDKQFADIYRRLDREAHRSELQDAFLGGVSRGAQAGATGAAVRGCGSIIALVLVVAVVAARSV